MDLPHASHHSAVAIFRNENNLKGMFYTKETKNVITNNVSNCS